MFRPTFRLISGNREDKTVAGAAPSPRVTRGRSGSIPKFKNNKKYNKDREKAWKLNVGMFVD